MGFAVGIRPVQVEDGGWNYFRFIATRVERIFSGAQRLLPNAAMARADERTVLEVRAAGVLRGEADVGFDDADLALLDDEHRHHFHADEKWIERVRAVEERIVLQADVAAVIEEGLKVLVIVVQIIFAAEQRLNNLGVVGVVGFHFCDVGKTAEAAGDVTGRKRVAFVSGDDADNVERGAVFSARLRLNADEFELFGFEAERCGHEFPAPAHLCAELRRDRFAVDAAARDDQEADGMYRNEGAWRQHRALNTLLAAELNEVAEIGKVRELLFVNGGFCADGQRAADLRDDDADFSRGNLNPRIFIDRIDEDGFPA